MARSKMVKYEVFIGVWNTTGKVLSTESNAPGQLSATDTYRWLPGRHFIVHEVDARFDGHPTRSMEIMGFNPLRKEYFAQSFDDQGSTDTYAVSLNGRHWKIEGETVRFDGSFDTQRKRLIGLWELKGNKSLWQPWIELELARA
jgi:hypothetical protein